MIPPNIDNYTATNNRLLFLDFDGVLQTPALEGWLAMELAAEVENLLAMDSDLRIVVTSTHREGKTLTDLKRMLPTAVAVRVIGATEVSALGRSTGGRQGEIENWLRSHKGFSKWAAVDDEPHLFEQGCPWLVTTNKYLGWSIDTTEAVRVVLSQGATELQERANVRRPTQITPGTDDVRLRI